MLNNKKISLVAAMGRNRVIGAGNDIPWKVPGEQQRFRQLTERHLVVMGRRTYESIGKPLPNRDTLVIGSQAIVAARVSTSATLSGAMEIISADSRNEVFIAGGGQIYRLFLPYADAVYLTRIDLEPEGDATFPDLPDDFYCAESRDVSGPIPYTFLTYLRRADPLAAATPRAQREFSNRHLSNQRTVPEISPMKTRQSAALFAFLLATPAICMAYGDGSDAAGLALILAGFGLGVWVLVCIAAFFVMRKFVLWKRFVFSAVLFVAPFLTLAAMAGFSYLTHGG